MKNKIKHQKRQKKEPLFSSLLIDIFCNTGTNPHFHRKIVISTIQAIFNFISDYYYSHNSLEIFFYCALKKNFSPMFQNLSIFFFFLNFIRKFLPFTNSFPEKLFQIFIL